MKIMEGSPISPGFASGIAIIYDYEVDRRLKFPDREILNTEVSTECDRIDDALKRSRCELKTAELTANNDPKLVDAATVLSAHAAMAGDIAALVKDQIECDLVNVEQALDSVICNWITRLRKIDDEYLRQREQDIRDVGHRLTRNLAGLLSTSHDSLPPGSIIVTPELLPSEAFALASSGVVAILSERGGTFSHTAIIARSLGIPAISGVTNVTTRILSGTKLLVDGLSGSVMIRPSEFDEAAFAVRQTEYDRHASKLLSEENLPCVTRDGVKISLMGNVGLPNELKQIAVHNLAGVGLFRTEFLYIDSPKCPSFDSQLEVYGDMAAKLAGLPMVIRTFDLGGDKLPPFLTRDDLIDRSNLHLRGLRFSLSETTLLDAQLRAIVQVAQSNDVRILFPMVIGSQDFSMAVAAVDRIVKQLDVLRRPLIGAMIETPAALFALDEILPLADFVAIGTNDLTQYMLAADRDLSEGTDVCTALHPAVLRAIKQIVQACQHWEIPVCVCGEEVADAHFARLLIGLGIRELSISPSHASATRFAIRGIDATQAANVAELALRCQSPGEVRNLFATPFVDDGLPNEHSKNYLQFSWQCP